MNKTRVLRFSFHSALVLGLLALASGCGGSTGSLTGHVSFKGKKVSDGTVTLVTEEGMRITARIRPDGSFKATEVPVGLVKIAVKSRGQTGLPPILVPRVPDDIPVQTDGGDPVPLSYGNAERSGLTCEVTAGEQTVDIDIP
jgi:hypothetical protein